MKNLRGQCRHCGGRFDFPAAQIGTMGDCPHCGRTIEMMLETPKTESAVPRRVVVYSLLAIALLGLGLLLGVGFVVAAGEATGENPSFADRPLSIRNEALPPETSLHARVIDEEEAAAAKNPVGTEGRERATGSTQETKKTPTMRAMGERRGFSSTAGTPCQSLVGRDEGLGSRNCAELAQATMTGIGKRTRLNK